MIRRTQSIWLVALTLTLVSCSGGDATTTSFPASPATAAESTTTSTAPATTLADEPPVTTSADTGSVISVFYSVADSDECGDVASFERFVSSSAEPIAGAFEELVAGPTDEEVDAGAGSFFSEATADAVLSVEIDDGFLRVDLDGVVLGMNNASTSCGSEALLATLNATAFQFADVDRVRYSIFGSCGSFYQWLQRECQDQTRDGSIAAALDTNEEASGSGCTPGSETLTDGEWFGFVQVAESSQIEFDLACWFTGVAAADAAAEDGEESPPPNDYYIRNVSSVVRQIPVAGATLVERLADSGGDNLAEVSYGNWASGWAEVEYQPGVWVTVSGGEVVHIVEQYVP